LEWVLRAHSSERAWRIRSRKVFSKAPISVGVSDDILCGVILNFAQRMNKLDLLFWVAPISVLLGGGLADSLS
jgi:hypothetical protein